MRMHEEDGVPLHLRLHALCEVPLRVYVEASAEYDTHPGPRWARFTFGVGMLLRICRLADVIKREKLEAVRQPGEPECWSSIAEEDPADPMRIENGSIEVTDTGFRFLAWIRHVDTRICTKQISVEELVRAAEGPVHAEALTYRRRGNVLFYAEDSDRKAFIADLQEEVEELEAEASRIT
jgi:hypothetical protein